MGRHREPVAAGKRSSIVILAKAGIYLNRFRVKTRRVPFGARNDKRLQGQALQVSGCPRES